MWDEGNLSLWIVCCQWHRQRRCWLRVRVWWDRYRWSRRFHWLVQVESNLLLLLRMHLVLFWSHWLWWRYILRLLVGWRYTMTNHLVLFLHRIFRIRDSVFAKIYPFHYRWWWFIVGVWSVVVFGLKQCWVRCWLFWFCIEVWKIVILWLLVYFIDIWWYLLLFFVCFDGMYYHVSRVYECCF